MKQTSHILRNGLEIVVREATTEDARSVLDYVEQVSSETDFLTFGPSDFGIIEMEEKEFLKKSRKQTIKFIYSD